MLQIDSGMEMWVLRWTDSRFDDPRWLFVIDERVFLVVVAAVIYVVYKQ